MKIYPIAFIFLVVFVGLVSCSPEKPSQALAEKQLIYTVNYPLAYFTERMAIEGVEVVFPEMEGDPAFWKPSAEQVAEFQKAHLILLNGASYAKWVEKVSLPQAKLVDTSAGFADQYIHEKNASAHTHGPEGAHTHGSVAFTTWLDPLLALKQVEAIKQALADRGLLDENGFEDLKKDLQDLHTEMQQAFAKVGDAPLLASHPVYQYVARRYDLNLQSVHWEPDVMPDDAMWREFDELLKKHPAKIMLWEAEPLAACKSRLEEKGVKVVVLDPCGNRPQKGDYFSVMKAGLGKIR
ncbi:MAG: metal ABC transporter substrate-binding protein [Verrucomicrobiales bacterium]|nr:metal ABC transporter substrate-binding protein [Verrucomicrobiales bacterium]